MPPKYARYGPVDRFDGYPKGGLCLSVFALVERQEDQSVLVGIPSNRKRWLSDWLYWKRKADGAEVFEQWRLPSLYLKEGEHPRSGLDRIMVRQLGIKKFKLVKPPRIFSFYSPIGWYKGEKHWDFTFVYQIELQETLKLANNWWKQLFFCKKGKELREKNFGWNNDLLEELNLAQE